MMPISTPYADPMDEPRVLKAWQAFLRGDHHTDLDRLRAAVGFSWLRCQQAQVNPNQQNAPLSDDDLNQRFASQRELLDASLPIMKEARQYLAESGSVMALADAQAHLLRTEGDTRTLGFAENIHFLPGACWSESACGTNAIGTALAIGQPIQVHSSEHYCEGIKRWTCSAAVIRHPVDSTIVAAVDISGLSSSYSRQNLALAVQVAGRIESRLMEAELQWRYHLLDAAMSWLVRSDRQGVLLFDRRGRLVRTNGLVIEQFDPQAFGGRRLASWTIDEIVRQADGDARPGWQGFDPRGIRREQVMHNGQLLGSVLLLPPRDPVRHLPQTRMAGAGTQAASAGRSAGSDAGAEPLNGRTDSAFRTVIGQSPAIREAVTQAQKLAASRVPVLLMGESGVGKEVFARGIHEAHSGAAGGGRPLVAINCGSFARELLSSELFGYAEGAFTGARRGGMKGKIEAADGGTLFLDEIGEMPLELQPHFLRVLEEGEVCRLGETQPRRVKFRLVAATHRDLREEVRAGRFRLDLFYRIAVTTIHLPPLRERREDIPLLARHLLQRLAHENGLPVADIAPQVLEVLQRQDWPGNIRELRNALEGMLLTCRGGMIELPDLSSELLSGAMATDILRGAAEATRGSIARTPTTPAAPATMAQTELEALQQAIADCAGNLTAVARQLGIAKSTVYLKVERYGLQDLIEYARTRSARAPLRAHGPH